MTQDQATEARRLFSENQNLVEEIIRRVGHRHHLRGDDVDELRSLVFFKLVDNDYAVLRKFQGKSSLRTYLATVVARVLLDHRVKEWGKWRPSSAARRLGAAAIRLEELIVRDGFSADEATRIVQMGPGVGTTKRDLGRLIDRLPPRVRRRSTSLDLESEPCSGERADSNLWNKERESDSHRMLGALANELEELQELDRSILDLRFVKGRKVSEIAALLGLNQRLLYRRIDRCLSRLRRRLKSQGVSRQLVADSIDP